MPAAGPDKFLQTAFTYWISKAEEKKADSDSAEGGRIKKGLGNIYPAPPEKRRGLA